MWITIIKEGSVETTYGKNLGDDDRSPQPSISVNVIRLKKGIYT
jgi:hypothetical protein